MSFVVINISACLGRTQLSDSNLADLPVASNTGAPVNYPGYGTFGGPSLWNFWVKDRRAAVAGNLSAFSQRLGYRYRTSQHFVLYRDPFATGAISSTADADEILNAAETAYANLLAAYGADNLPDPVKNQGRIVIFMYDIVDDYGGDNNAFVGGFFAPRDLYNDDYTHALFTDPDVILFTPTETVASLRGRSNENKIVYIDTNPFFNGSAFGGDATKGKNLVKETVIHEVSHLFTYWYRVNMFEKPNHDLWIAEGIAEQAPQLTASLTVSQQERMTLHANPLIQAYLGYYPGLTEDKAGIEQLAQVLNWNLFFNYLRHRIGNDTGSRTFIKNLVQAADHTASGLASNIASQFSGSESFDSIFGDYVLTNLVRSYNQPTGITVSQYFAQGGSEVTGGAFTSKLVELSYSNVSAISFATDSTPLNSDPDNKCLPPASVIYHYYQVTNSEQNWQPTNPLDSNDIAMDEGLRIYELHVENPAAVVIREYLPTDTIPLSTYTAGDRYIYAIYNPNLSGDCLNTGDEVRVFARNLARWLGGSLTGWQNIPGATTANSQASFFRPRGVANTTSGTNYAYVVDNIQHSVNRWNLTTGTFDGRLGSTDSSCALDDTSDDGFRSLGAATKFRNNECRRGFNAPEDVAVDSNGFVYVADTVNHRIKKYDSNGNFIAWLGSPTDDKWQCEPGNAYASCVGMGTEDPIDMTTAPNLGTDLCLIYNPISLVIDESGATDYMYIVSRAGHRVTRRRLDNGTFEGYIGQNATGGFNDPSTGNCNCVTATPASKHADCRPGVGSGSQAHEFQLPRGIAANSTHIYVADAGNHRISRFNLDGSSPMWLGGGSGGDGFTWSNANGPATAGSSSSQFSQPADIALFGSHILIADQNNHRVMRRTLAGAYAGYFGAGSTIFSLENPSPYDTPGEYQAYLYPPELVLFPIGLSVFAKAGSGLDHDYLLVTSIYNGRLARWNLDCLENNTSLTLCSLEN